MAFGSERSRLLVAYCVSPTLLVMRLGTVYVCWAHSCYRSSLILLMIYLLNIRSNSRNGPLNYNKQYAIQHYQPSKKQLLKVATLSQVKRSPSWLYRIWLQISVTFADKEQLRQNRTTPTFRTSAREASTAPRAPRTRCRVHRARSGLPRNWMRRMNATAVHQVSDKQLSCCDWISCS